MPFVTPDPTPGSAPPIGDISSYGTTATGSGTSRSLGARAADVVNVKDFGAAGDGVSDDTAEIQAALDYAGTYANGAAVFFPAGFYLVTSTLRVRNSYCRLFGCDRTGTGTSTDVVGSTISGTGGIGTLLLVQATSGAIFGTQIENLHLRSDGSGSDPIGISVIDGSETYITNVTCGQHFSYGLNLDGCNLIWVQGLTTSTTQVGIRLTKASAATFTACDNVYFSNLNLWESTSAGIRIDGPVNDLLVRDSWIEHTPAGVLVNHVAGTTFSVEGVTVSDTVVFNGVSSSYTNSRFFKGAAAASADFLSIRNVLLRNCRAYNISATNNVELAKGTNSHVSTAMRNVQIDGGQWYGASTSVLTADSSSYTGVFRGNIFAQAGYQTGATVPFAAGTGTYTYETRQFRDLDSTSASVVPFLAVSSDRGDTSQTLTVNVDAPIQRWATALTANRTVTLSTTGARNGDTFRIVRSGAGVFSLAVGSLATLYTPGWVEVAYDGSAWVLIGSS